MVQSSNATRLMKSSNAATRLMRIQARPGSPVERRHYIYPERGWAQLEPDAIARGASLRVSFKQDVREADMRKALAEIDGEIVGGPGQLGVYLVRIKVGNPATAAQRLRAHGITVLVEIIGKGR